MHLPSATGRSSGIHCAAPMLQASHRLLCHVVALLSATSGLVLAPSGAAPAPSFAALKDDPRRGALLAAARAKIGLDREARDFQVPLLDGTTFRLSDQKGKVVLVDFWDVRCPPCRKELPRLKAMFGEFRDHGLVILGISLDTDRQLLADYLKETAPTWNMACSFRGWDDDTAKLYKVSATPSTWLIDRSGVLRFFNLRGETLERAVSDLLRET